MNSIRIVVGTGLLLLASNITLAQELVDATDANRLADIIRDLGYKAAVSTDNVGDPMIESSVGGTDITVLFFGCEDNLKCTSVLFKVGYDLSDGTTLEVINAWNEQNLFGRAYMDDELDPWIEMPVNLFDGVTRSNFEDSFDWWEVVVGKFEDHVGY
jgi:hypothetical protein